MHVWHLSSGGVRLVRVSYGLGLCVALLVALGSAPGSAQTVRPGTAPGQSVAPAAAMARPALSEQAAAVKDIADRGGDRTFLMLDKTRGEIILFVDGAPIYSGAALTGQNPSDVLPREFIVKPFSYPSKFEEKITPAGRFTLSREPDSTYGTVFTINEIKGPDWDIAIHRVANVPNENRPERLRSANAADRLITNGCVNVAIETIRVLERYLGGQNIPIYILPRNNSMTATLFMSARSGPSQSTRTR